MVSARPVPLGVVSPPAREAWIEIRGSDAAPESPQASPPAREAWIEIGLNRRGEEPIRVASREGGVD